MGRYKRTYSNDIYFCACVCFAIAALLSVILISFNFVGMASAEELSTNNGSSLSDDPIEVKDSYEYEKQTYPWQEYGYTSIIDYHNDLISMNESAIGLADKAIDSYSSVVTDEQIDLLRRYEDKMVNALTINRYKEYENLYNDLVAELDSELSQIIISQSYSSSGNSGYYQNGSGLTKSGGVNYYNGRTETWYSSNILYHYRTNEWTVDSEGFYRTNEGYYVVAASDMPQGTTFEGSKGTCIVLDSGCASGVTDYYTKF